MFKSTNQKPHTKAKSDNKLKSAVHYLQTLMRTSDPEKLQQTQESLRDSKTSYAGANEKEHSWKTSYASAKEKEHSWRSPCIRHQIVIIY